MLSQFLGSYLTYPTTALRHTFVRNFLLTLLANMLLFLLWSPGTVYAGSDLKRLDYQLAIKQLRQRNWQDFYQSMENLKNYPLYPYLEYHQINAHLSRLPRKAVHTFLSKYAGTPVAEKLRHRWLNMLIKRGQWQQYIDDWDKSITNTRLKCFYLRSKYRTGDVKDALDATLPLWLVGKSQPSACDPLFKEWIHEGYLTQDIAWRRLELAFQNKRYRLSRYIVNKLLKDHYKTLGTLWLQMHRKPSVLSQHNKMSTLAQQYPNKMRKIVAYGLQRMARKDVVAARKEWQIYREKLAFNIEDIANVKRSLTLAATLQRHNNATSQWLINSQVTAEDPSITELRIRAALHKTDWPNVSKWINVLPKEIQQTQRWQYWRARANEKMKQNGSNVSVSPKLIYQNLAQNRTYYGFLSADQINARYAMHDQPLTMNKDETNKIMSNPAIIRALELYALDYVNDARREWHFGTRGFDAKQLTFAAKLADNAGWHEKSIQSLIKAESWNDLKARFPLAYNNSFLAASKTHRLDPRWLYAIARQESAFSPDAKSHAGALGLMQLMPRTAKHTARQIGINFKKSDLLEPVKNITLGSNYLKNLLEKFDGNRILATTAYNAGPHRVKKWLNHSRNNLTYDIWIETIPFSETRNYVQNVLAFSVIYGYRMNTPSPLISSREAAQAL